MLVERRWIFLAYSGRCSCNPVVENFAQGFARYTVDIPRSLVFSYRTVTAAWITHVLEGAACFVAALKGGMTVGEAAAWAVDATLVGAGATSILFKKLRIAKPSHTTAVCLTGFAIIAALTFKFSP